MVYTPEMRTQVRAKAVEVYKQNLTEWVERGAVLTETDGGRVRAEFVIGGEVYSPIPPFPKAYLADAGTKREGSWTRRTLTNLDGYITKAQIEADVADAVAGLPLDPSRM